MPNSLHSKARFIPSEELQDSQVRVWRFGEVTLGGLGEGALPPAMQHLDDFHPLMPHHEGQHDALPVAEPDVVPVLDAEQDEAQQAAASPPPEPAQPMIDEEQLQQMLEQARQEGFAHGQEQGAQQTAQEWQQRLEQEQAQWGRDVGARLASVLRQAQQGIAGLQQQVAPDLLQLACDIARQVVRRELTNQPQALLPVVREALDMLVNEGRVATVRLHPHDLSAVENHLRGTYAQGRVQWQADPAVAPGDCLVESAGTVIDGSMEKRWRRAVAALGLVSSWQEGDDDGD